MRLDTASALQRIGPMVWELLKSMRPQQWVKNLFVLAPLVFSQNLLTPDLFLLALLGMALFCATSGAVYLINDLFDIERDRVHPIKRHRPIASGRLSRRAAWVAAVSIVSGGLACAAILAPWFAVILGGYAALNLWYSLHLKHVVFLDVTVIATGFLLRVLAGGLVVDVPISAWLIICTFLLSLYLALGKRKHELHTVGAERQSRGVLRHYELSHIKTAMVIAAVVTLLSYSGYTLDPATVEEFNTRWLPLSIPCIAIGLSRFYRLTQSFEFGSPTELMLRDRIFVGNILIWAILMVVIIYT